LRGGGGFTGLRRIQFVHAYDDIISLENLLEAWKEFVKGKRKRKDVQEFERDLMGNIISLHNDLASKTYEHSPYEFFRIYDPKRRDIHKAEVRDRLLHHALHRKLYPFFDRRFISDSFSCRLGKGTHKAMDRFRSFAYKASQNHTKTVWVLKCDIRKFFASIDQEVLIGILDERIPDKNTVGLLSKVIKSFSSVKKGIGLPLGNLTSQLLVNVYMNEFDQFVKHKLKAKYYIRYADDFIIISRDKEWLIGLLPPIKEFLSSKLKLQLHPRKISIKTIASGVDYLGWVTFPDHRVLRTATKKRMFRGIRQKQGKAETVQSYLGLISHGNAKKLESLIKQRKDDMLQYTA
jgi:retron-type reverse transcriptase